MSDGQQNRAERTTEERKGYPAAPAKPAELPSVPKGPAPGGGSSPEKK